MLIIIYLLLTLHRKINYKSNERFKKERRF
nr:MAG TPA: hypothetical protein [Caudoviricetes sp.]